MTIEHSDVGVSIRTADTVNLDTLWRAFREGFRDYIVPVEIAQEPFAALLESEHVDLAASVVALDADSAPAGICLLAIWGEESWCGGLGVAPPWRRRGLGRRLMLDVIEKARTLGLELLRLECIDGNHGARALYDRLGFQPVRQLSFFDGRASAVQPTADREVSHLGAPASVWTEFDAYHLHRRPWQQDLPSLELVRDASALPGVCLGDPTRPDAYLIYRAPAASNGRLVIVDSGSRNGDEAAVEALSLLAGTVLRRHPGATVFVPNVPDDDPLKAALTSHGVPTTLTQTEMVLNL